MNRSELIALISGKQPHLPLKDVELAVKCILDVMTATVANGERIEIRDFGSFATVKRDARIGRNPKTGESVSLPNRYAVQFKAGLEMRNRVNDSRLNYPVISDL